MHTHLTFPSADRARNAFAHTLDILRGEVRRIGSHAGRLVDRASDLAESYIGVKVKRKVKPPILAALALGGVALVVALVAAFRK